MTGYQTDCQSPIEPPMLVGRWIFGIVLLQITGFAVLMRVEKSRPVPRQLQQGARHR